MSPNNAATPLRVGFGSDVYSSTMTASHEFLDLRAWLLRHFQDILGDFFKRTHSVARSGPKAQREGIFLRRLTIVLDCSKGAACALNVGCR
jgi:hypothetical protein